MVMSAFNVRSKQCPVCAGKSVYRINTARLVRAPSFRCPDCGAELTTAITPQVLWAVPTCALAFGLVFLVLTWLRQSDWLHGAAFGGAFGGLFGGAYAISAKVAMKGIVYRPWEP